MEKKATGKGEQGVQAGGWRSWGGGEKVFPQNVAEFRNLHSRPEGGCGWVGWWVVGRGRERD